MAYSLYLWHWPLLIFWLAYTGGERAQFLDGLAILLISGAGLPDHALHRGAAALPAFVGRRRREAHSAGAQATSPPGRRRRHRHRTARRGAGHHLVHLA